MKVSISLIIFILLSLISWISANAFLHGKLPQQFYLQNAYISLEHKDFLNPKARSLSRTFDQVMRHFSKGKVGILSSVKEENIRPLLSKKVRFIGIQRYDGLLGFLHCKNDYLCSQNNTAKSYLDPETNRYYTFITTLPPFELRSRDISQISHFTTWLIAGTRTTFGDETYLKTAAFQKNSWLTATPRAVSLYLLGNLYVHNFFFSNPTSPSAPSTFLSEKDISCAEDAYRLALRNLNKAD